MTDALTRVRAFIERQDEAEVLRADEYQGWGRANLDFLIGEYDDYSSGRVSQSQLTLEEGKVRTGVIHAPTVVESYALERAGTTEDLTEKISVNVIDNVLHVYFSKGASVDNYIKVVRTILEEGDGTALERVQNISYE